MNFPRNTYAKLTYMTRNTVVNTYCFLHVRLFMCWRVMSVLFAGVMFMTTLHAQPSHANYQSMTLRIELSPAQCAINPKRSRLRQCREGFALTVAGLRPEPYTRGQPCSRSGAKLPPLQAKVVSRIMPDKVMRDLAWRYYGSCMGMSSPNYFRFIANLSGQLKVPKELSSGNNYVVSRELFEQQLQHKNKGLDALGLQMLCQNTPDAKSQVLTELQVCYDSAGKFGRCAQKVSGSCPATFMIKGLP